MQKLYAQFIRCNYNVSTDSRKVECGSMFFALHGENFDGNQYAAKALGQGAAKAVVDDASVSDGSDRYIIVENTLQTLQSLATYHRTQLNIPIIGLTGSNGKTTTKEFLRLALSAGFEHIGCTQGNLNNHIGVPLTLLSFTDQTQIGIVEMGANHLGEIALLCSIARPNIGLITNVGLAHLEGFGGRDGVRKGKGELLDFLAQNQGVAIYNSDDPILADMVSQRKGLRSIGYKTDRSSYLAPIFGRYNTFNALAAINIASYFGIAMDAATKKIDSYTSDNNRSQIMHTWRDNTLVVDCYNANPSSMIAAIDEFVSLASDKAKLVILGNMGELGSFCADEHRKIEQTVANNKLDAYFVGAHWEVEHFADVNELNIQLTKEPITGKTILIKGSRSVKLEKTIEKL